MKLTQKADSDIKHAATLGLLIGMAFMIPSFRDGFIGSNIQVAAEENTANVFSISALSNLTKCPKGHTCTQNPDAIPGVVARTTGDSKLALTYDSNKKEALLTATFTIVVDGGKVGVYVYQYPMISFRDSSGQAYYVNSARNAPLSPVSNAVETTDLYGQTIYWVAPNQSAKFKASATVDPKSLFAGKYYATVDALLGYPTATSTGISIINVNSDNTNFKVIVGETAPYISSLTPNQANVGDSVTITGQRLGGAQIYIDNVALSSYTPNNPTTGSLDGTMLGFKVPNMVSGWHIITVGNAMGMSNGFGFQALNGIPKPELSIIEVASPSAQVFSSGTKNNTLGYIKLTATNGDVKLGDIILNGEPNLANLPLSPFYIYEGSTLLGTGYVNGGANNQLLSYSVTIPTNITIFSGTTRKLTLSADATNLGTTSIRMAAGIGGQAGADFNVVFDPNAQMHTYVVVVNQNCSAGFVCGETSQPVFSNMSVSRGVAVSSQTGMVAQQVNFNFSVTAGTVPIFMSNDINKALVTSLNSTQLNVSPVKFGDDNSAGDGSMYIYIAPGQTKNVGATYTVTGMKGSSGTLQVTAINYGTSTSALSNLVFSDTSMLKAALFTIIEI
ncbi:MAG: hypothetical protein V4524_01990 [Patescibacteria group bacterium]